MFVEAQLEAELAATPLPTLDRHLCQELVFGVTRWQATLDFLIGRKTDGRPQKPLLQAILRLGLYQIFWLEKIPNHAAVSETVQLAKEMGYPAQAGFVNAVLRSYLRETEATRTLLSELKSTRLHLGYSHPEWLVNRWLQRWGAGDTSALLGLNNTPPSTFARVNTLKTTAEKLLPQWRDEGVQYDFFHRDWVPVNLVFELKAHPPFARLPSFQQGFFYIQDPSTLLAPAELKLEPGSDLLDLCAAPGGKVTCAAQWMENQGRIIAHDLSPDRLQLVRQNCERLGVKIAQPVLPQELAGVFPHSFDRILVDAPCSNTGVMRRRVDLRWRIQPAEIRRLAVTQTELLNQAASLLRPGGVLVYSTCSLEPEENREVVSAFLETHPQFRLEKERELLPFRDQVDGAYVAVLKHGPT